MKIQFWHGIFLLLIIILFLSSCLEMTTEIRLNTDGTVNTRLVYKLSAPSFGETWGGEEPWLMPLSEEYFIQRSLIESGTEIVSYKSRSNNDSKEFSVKLKSRSVESLARYLGINLEQEGNSEEGKLVLDLQLSRRAAKKNTPWREKNLEQLLRDSVFIIRVFPHAQIKYANAGKNTKKTAELELSLFDVFFGNAVEKWIVSWS